TDSGTAAERWTSPWSLSRIKNIFYYSYIRCLKTLPSHADAIARSIGGVLGSPRVHSLDLRIRGLGDRSGRVRTLRRVPTALSGVFGTRLVLRSGRRRSASHRLSRLLVAGDHVGSGRDIGVGQVADEEHGQEPTCGQRLRHWSSFRMRVLGATPRRSSGLPMIQEGAHVDAAAHTGDIPMRRL